MLLRDRWDSSVSQIGGLDSASYKAFLIGKVGADVMKDQIFNTIRRHYEQQFGKSWVDKTPGIDMVQSVPRLAGRFSDSGFIFMRRRAIENIESRFRRFKHRNFRSACSEWTGVMRAWSEIRPKMQGRYIEIDQQRMIFAVDRVAKELGNFLELDEIDRKRVETYLTNTRTEQTLQSIVPMTLGINETQWSPREKEIFLEECAAMMALYAYPFETAPVETGENAGVVPFCFVAGVPDVRIDTEDGGTLFWPQGLNIVSGDTIKVSNFALSGQSSFRGRVQGPSSAHLGMVLEIFVKEADIMVAKAQSSMVASSPDDLIVDFAKPIFGNVEITLHLRAIDGTKKARLTIREPRFC